MICTCAWSTIWPACSRLFIIRLIPFASSDVSILVASLRTTSATAATYAAGLTVSGGTAQWGDIITFAPASGTTGGATVSRRLRLSAGQTVQLVGAQGSGGALAYAVGAQNQTRFIALWEGS